MFTQLALEQHIRSFIQCLREEAGYPIERVILFGSYAKGGVKPTSDIDLAIWSPAFEGSLFVDLPPIAGLVSRFHPISIRPYSQGTSALDDPFIDEVEKTGREIRLI